MRKKDEKKVTLAVGVAQTFKHKIPNGGEVSGSLMKFNYIYNIYTHMSGTYLVINFCM
jgi:hypothetical protein